MSKISPVRDIRVVFDKESYADVFEFSVGSNSLKVSVVDIEEHGGHRDLLAAGIEQADVQTVVDELRKWLGENKDIWVVVNDEVSEITERVYQSATSTARYLVLLTEDGEALHRLSLMPKTKGPRAHIELRVGQSGVYDIYAWDESTADRLWLRRSAKEGNESNNKKLGLDMRTCPASVVESELFSVTFGQ